LADESEHLLVTSPLGQGLAELGADGDGAWIDTAEHRHYSAATLDDLCEQVFGARLPLSYLSSWVLARAAGSTVDRLVLDDFGRPESFVEAGWQISYPSYESRAPDALPSAMRLTRDPLDVRLKVDQWNLLP
jgi:outer membrane lipoprotein LolB